MTVKRLTDEQISTLVKFTKQIKKTNLLQKGATMKLDGNVYVGVGNE